MNIFSWGSNGYGQQGVGNEVDYNLPNKSNLLLNLKEIKSIFCSSTCSFIVNIDGSVMVSGNNNQGQLGIEGEKQYLNFIKLENLFRLKVNTVANGWDFSVLLVESGDIYASGNNHRGQLGVNHREIERLYKFTKITLPPMTSVKAGMRHVVALSADNQIWSWGYNNKAQLGIYPPNRVPRLPAIMSSDNTEEIVFISAGCHHGGFITKSWKVTMWGDNQYGQCGANITDDNTNSVVRPRLMSASFTYIDQFESGWNHNVVRNKHGSCYTWGSNRYKELGRAVQGGHLFDPIPDCVDSFVEKGIVIRDISCGNEHNLAIDVDNRLWSWGWNDHGMLGQGDEIDREVPNLVHNLSPTVRIVSRGGSHSFAIVI